MKTAITAFRKLGAIDRILWCLQILLLAAALSLHFTALRYAFESRKFSFLDFRCYYIATSLHGDGGNPYYRAPSFFPFVYAPTTLYFFKCFTVYHVREAERQWFVVKCAILFLLVYLWRTHLSLRLGPKQGLLLAYGFSCTIVQDLVTGNVSLVEQLLLWSGLAALIGRRKWIFGICVVLASQFKLTTLAFLPCLFLMNGDAPERRKQWVALAGSAGLFAATMLINSVIWHSWYRDMAGNLAHIDYNGANCDPCSRAFLEDLAVAVRLPLCAANLRLIVTALYLVFVLAVLVVSGRALREHWRKRRAFEPVACILFACLVYALVLPRLKLYSYVLILPPAMYMAARMRSWLARVIFAVCLLPTHNLVYPLPSVPRAVAAAYDHAHIPALISNYTSLFALFGLWLWFVAELSRKAKNGMHGGT